MTDLDSENQAIDPEEASLIVGLRKRSIRVFGGSGAAAAWMLSRPPVLNGKRVIELALTQSGLVLAHRILDDLEDLNTHATGHLPFED